MIGHFKAVTCVGLMTLITAGCVSLPDEPKTGPERPFTLTLEEVEKPLVKGDWGLAMSGGGLRSALFNIGVLKAMYEQGQLERTGIISTVSGGGYTGYWLYTNQLAEKEKSQKFGDRVFDKEIFPVKACEAFLTGNFVTYKQVAYATVTTETLIDIYEKSIGRTFGGSG